MTTYFFSKISFATFCCQKMGKYSAVESLLIEEVKKYPGLWKTTDPEYKNRAAKDSAWEAITETVNAAANTTYSGKVYHSVGFTKMLNLSSKSIKIIPNEDYFTNRNFVSENSKLWTAFYDISMDTAKNGNAAVLKFMNSKEILSQQ